MSKFDLASFLDKNVLKSNTLEIVNIQCSQIKTNDENFFEVANVDELAESIELIGLQQPLVVTKSSNGYLLIAGHRRFSAVKSLGWETVPCIISSQANSELEMLALIQTNTQTRDLTYAERMEAAKRTEEILVSLKEKGYKFSGRLRDKIGEVIGENGSTIARMQAIEKNLDDEAKEMLAKGELTPEAAYQMQQMPTDKQKELVSKLKDKKISPTVKDIKAFKETEVQEVEQVPTLPVWDWKPVSEKPSKSCDIIFAEKYRDKWEYRCICAVDNFDEWVEIISAEFWAEIQAPI